MDKSSGELSVTIQLGRPTSSSLFLRRGAMRTTLAALVFVLAFNETSSVRAEDGLVKVESQQSVLQTVESLESVLKERGIAIAARIDHAAGARAAGLSLPDTVVITFGNPKLGTPLIAASPEVAIDLPLRILVWQSPDGKVLLGYTPPSVLLGRYGLGEKQQAVEAMTKLLSSVVQSASKSP
jgi:uncharacterized protein (DUF302 family)